MARKRYWILTYDRRGKRLCPVYRGRKAAIHEARYCAGFARRGAGVIKEIDGKTAEQLHRAGHPWCKRCRGMK